MRVHKCIEIAGYLVFGIGNEDHGKDEINHLAVMSGGDLKSYERLPASNPDLKTRDGWKERPWYQRIDGCGTYLARVDKPLHTALCRISRVCLDPSVKVRSSDTRALVEQFTDEPSKTRQKVVKEFIAAYRASQAVQQEATQ